MGTFVKSHNRFPAVAGKLYPDNADVLDRELEKMSQQAVAPGLKGVQAIITPHANILLSGRVAASAYNQIDTSHTYERVFVMGTSHHDTFNGASVYCDGDFVMPGGTVEVDGYYGRQLTQRYPELFTASRSPHLQEHSIEMQLPFLQKTLGTSFKLVPILLSIDNQEQCREIAAVLKDELLSGQLFVISSDFSHFLSSDDARRVDAETEAAILTNDPVQLLKVLKQHSEGSIAGWQSSLCGWSAVLTLLYMTCAEEQYRYRAVDSSNSGDVAYYGDPNQVVGYRSIALTVSLE